MEFILLGILLIIFYRPKQGIPQDPLLPKNYEAVHLDPKLQEIIDRHGFTHNSSDSRKVSPRYRNGP
jgi:hypothetical protein